MPHIAYNTVLAGVYRLVSANKSRDGGMPPLLVEPIDFAALYRARAGELRQTGGTA